MDRQTGVNGNGDGRLAWNLREAAIACGVSVPFLRKTIEKGELATTRAGRRVLIPDYELRRWLGLNGEANTQIKAA